MLRVGAEMPANLPQPVRRCTKPDTPSFMPPRALKTAQNLSFGTLQCDVASSNASTRTESPYSSCSRSPSPGHVASSNASTRTESPYSSCSRTPSPDKSVLLKKCLEIEEFLEKAESLTGGGKNQQEDVISPPSVWPELTPESAGYMFTQDICQVATGSVKLAEKAMNGSFRVVKCFEKAKLQKEAEDQMREEVELMLTLGTHHNIVTALQVFQDADSYYVVQPFYAGGNLVNLKARAVGAGVVTTEEWWMSLATQCLEGLAHMHAQDVIHCDIKEQNIMLRGDDLWEPEVVIIDLGVAQRSSTQRSIIYGTPGYIPPEVWEAKNWHQQSDMFSLGVVVLQTLIGRMGIFTDDTITFKDVEEATRCRSPPFDAIPSEYPRLKWLAQKLLVKDFRSRPSALGMLQEPWEDVQAVPKSQRRHSMPDVRILNSSPTESNLLRLPSACLRGPPRNISEVDSPTRGIRTPGPRCSPMAASHARLGFPVTPCSSLGYHGGATPATPSYHGGATPATPGSSARPIIAFGMTVNRQRHNSFS